MTERECRARLPKGFDWVDCSDRRFREALSEIWSDESSVIFISGQGGCGKSVLYQIAYYKNPYYTKALASTGRAAENLRNDASIPATTIHSGLGIGCRDLYDQPYKADADLTKRQLEALDGVKTILIDEVSMVSANLMDEILWMIDKYRDDYGIRIRLILFGDPLQLQPVVTDSAREYWSKRCPEEWEKAYGNGECFFDSKRFKAVPKYKVKLERVMRQGDGQAAFKTALDNIRSGKATQSDADVFRPRIMDEAAYASSTGNGYLYLTGTNAEAERINNERMSIFRGKTRTYHAGYGIPDGVRGPKDPKEIEALYGKEFREAFPQYFRKGAEGWTADVPLAPGMQVMVTTNLPSKGVANGTLGTVVSIIGSNSDRHDLLTSVRISYEGPGKKIMTTDITPVRLGLSRAWMEMDEDGWADEYAYMWVLPLKPAYAMTFHKAQGLTLDRVYINSGTRYVAPGAMYVALSRCRSLEGIGLSTALSVDKLQPPVRSLSWYSEQLW